MCINVTAPIEAPNAEIQRLIGEADAILVFANEDRYHEATAKLETALTQAPIDHPIRVLCLKRLAKIARVQGSYNLARRRLTLALGTAVQLFGLGHAHTLRLVEKMALVVKAEAHATERKKFIPAAVDKLYAGPIANAEALGLAAAAALLKGDCAYLLERWEQACEYYNEAFGLLRSDLDDSNWPRLRMRLKQARYERDA
jgi:tetratricopeptide (TPR) repeat protein